MHRCLNIDELLRVIAINLIGDSCSLFYMALTCKAFHEPAIDFLWERLPGLGPLLSLLPEDAYKISKVSDRGTGDDDIEDLGVLRITRIPRKEEWARVQHFAPRVRDLLISHLDSDDPYTVSPDAMHIVNCHYPNPILLPNLRKLSIEDGSFDPYSQLFASPRLEILELSQSCLTPGLCQCLESKGVCGLRKLHVTLGEMIASGQGVREPALVDALSRVVLSQTRIESVDLPTHLSEQALVHLAHVPFLRRLEIDFCAIAYRGTLKKMPTNFSHLTEMTLRAGRSNEDVAALTSFLDVIPHPSPLKGLVIYFTASATDTSLPGFFSAVSRFTSLTQCRLVSFSHNNNWDGAPVSADILEPLYRIKGMSQLALPFLPMDVSPVAIHKMAGAWPNIELLVLGHQHPQSTPRLTMEDIAPFVTENCRSLEMFGAVFISDSKPDWVPPSSIPPSTMSVDVGNSRLRLEDAPRVAAVLAKLLPAGRLTARPWAQPVREETRTIVDWINDLKDACLENDGDQLVD